MADYLFLGDSITDADHLFEPTGLGTGFVSLIAQDPRMKGQRVRNKRKEVPPFLPFPLRPWGPSDPLRPWDPWDLSHP